MNVVNLIATTLSWYKGNKNLMFKLKMAGIKDRSYRDKAKLCWLKDMVRAVLCGVLVAIINQKWYYKKCNWLIDTFWK